MILLTTALLLAGFTTAALALYLVALAVLAVGYVQPAASGPPHARITVLVPAHDERILIGRCVRALLAQSYPRELYRVGVIADNCTDDTAALAAAAGADLVLARDAPEARGKGRALRWAMDRVLAEDPACTAIVVVDADSVVDPDLLLRLAAPLAAGALAVQSDYRLFGGEGDGGGRAALREAGFILTNWVRPAGRARFGLSATLVGNGMLLSTELLRARPWTAFTSTEDLEYSLDLQADGIGIAFAGDAIVRAPIAPSTTAAAAQELRWDGGRANLMRSRIPRLIAGAVQRRRPELLLVAFDLAVPPLGFLTAAAVGGLVAAAALAWAGAVAVFTALPWMVAAAAIPVYVLAGLIAADAPASAYRALVHAPLFVLGKALRVRRTLSFGPDNWIRTERAAGDATEL